MIETARSLSLSFCHVSIRVTLGSEPAAKPSNRWHEPHSIMPNYWWLLRQVHTIGRHAPTREPTENTEEWGSPCSKLYTVRGGWDGVD